MNQLKHINEELLDRIVSVAYGDAGIVDRIKIYFEARKNPAIKKLLDEYKGTASAVHSIASEKFPAEIIESVTRKIKIEAVIKKQNVYDSIRNFLKKPAVTFTIAAIVLSLFALLLLQKPKEEKKYSKAQVESAEKQVKESLALVGKVFKKTQLKLADDVLGKHVSPPIKKSINLINDLFKGG